jgi:hypothetical protein
VQDRGLELEEQVVTLKRTWAGEFLGGMSEMKRLSTTCQVSWATQPSAAVLRLGCQSHILACRAPRAARCRFHQRCACRARSQELKTRVPLFQTKAAKIASHFDQLRHLQARRCVYTTAGRAHGRRQRAAA